MRPLFAIGVQYDEKANVYVAQIESLTDGKISRGYHASMKVLLQRMERIIKAKAKEIKKFPLPEPSRIITPNGKRAPNLIVLPGKN